MGRLFGTDGARGVANTELSCELAMQIGRASAYVLTRHTSERPMILIGRDTRISSKMLESALVAGICSVGADATSIGVVPTPAVAYLTQKYQCDVGIMISASHNPVEFNGIKLFNSQGYKLPDELEEEIEKYILDTPEEIPLPEGEKIGRQFSRRSAVSDYIRHIASSLGDDDLSGLTIAVDCANGSASTTADQLFHSLGVKPLLIHAQPDGTNINLNCGSTHLESLRDFVIKHRCRCGIAFDGDADRCLAVDENGDLIDGDQMIAIFASHMKKKGKLANNTAVVTVMSNLGFFHFAKENGIETEATGVGDRYVLERMREKGHCIGGEQSGHIIFSEYATTGDGQLTAVQLLNILKQEDVPLSTLASCMKKFPQVCKNIEASAETKQAFSDSDYLKEYIENKNQQLGDNGRILVRPSGTEPLIRIMVEGRSMDEISAIAEEIAEEIQKNT